MGINCGDVGIRVYISNKKMISNSIIFKCIVLYEITIFFPIH